LEMSGTNRKRISVSAPRPIRKFSSGFLKSKRNSEVSLGLAFYQPVQKIEEGNPYKNDN
jgi:hypothetical protein